MLRVQIVRVLTQQKAEQACAVAEKANHRALQKGNVCITNMEDRAAQKDGQKGSIHSYTAGATVWQAARSSTCAVVQKVDHRARQKGSINASFVNIKSPGAKGHVANTN